MCVHVRVNNEVFCACCGEAFSVSALNLLLCNYFSKYSVCALNLFLLIVYAFMYI